MVEFPFFLGGVSIILDPCFFVLHKCLFCTLVLCLLFAHSPFMAVTSAYYVGILRKWLLLWPFLFSYGGFVRWFLFHFCAFACPCFSFLYGIFALFVVLTSFRASGVICTFFFSRRLFFFLDWFLLPLTYIMGCWAVGLECIVHYVDSSILCSWLRMNQVWNVYCSTLYL